MNLLTLAETLFVEIINGRPGLSDHDVRITASIALRYAELFEAQNVDENEVDPSIPSTKIRTCWNCLGMGGGKICPCKTCGLQQKAVME